MSTNFTVTNTKVLEAAGPKTVEETVTFKVTCDGPRCQETDSACKRVLEWSESTDTKKSNVPDEFYRLINFKVGPGKPLDFFTKDCLRDHMRSYVAPLSPRELAHIESTRVQKTDEPISTSAVFTNPDSDATGVKE